MGGCYSAFACSRKLRGRISFVLPVTERDRDDRYSDGGASSAASATPSLSPSPHKNAAAAVLAPPGSSCASPVFFRPASPLALPARAQAVDAGWVHGP